MKRRKPDILTVLAVLVAFGVLVSGWTQAALSDAQAAPRTDVIHKLSSHFTAPPAQR